MYVYLESARAPAGYYLLYLCATYSYVPHDHVATLWTVYLPARLEGSAKDYIVNHEQDADFQEVLYVFLRNLASSPKMSHEELVQEAEKEASSLDCKEAFASFLSSDEIVHPILKTLREIVEKFHGFDSQFKVKILEYSS